MHEHNRKAEIESHTQRGKGKGKQAAVPATKSPVICRHWKNGWCDKGDACKFTHDQRQQSNTNPAAPSPKAKAKSKAKAKATPAAPNERGRSKSRSASAGARNRSGSQGSQGWQQIPKKPCYNYARGSCTKGDKCNFEHRTRTKSEREQMEKNARPRSPTPPRQSQKSEVVCRNMVSDGTCRFGDRCDFNHDSKAVAAAKAAGPQAKASPKGKAKGKPKAKSAG